ncbi:Scd6-like Sm domain-containing protein [Lipomyces arxii]|uniref:Scd6-like Sm domain-containing protein n=1 Tax=Lipomyces arxii TaxID=56418 RepID=UPI0034CF92A5
MSNYIGSRISLFSNSDIRYSGILHDIDSEASTLTLRQVRSFGTEGRLGNPDLEVPAGDTVYEFIVFRGAEVKDLVIDGSEQPVEPVAPSDPAVMQAQPDLAAYPMYQPPPPGYMPQYYPQSMYPHYPMPIDPNMPIVPPMSAPGAPGAPGMPLAAGFAQNRAPMRQPAGPPSQAQPSQQTTENKQADAPVAPTRTAVVPAVPVPKQARQPRQPATASSSNAADELAKRLAHSTVADTPVSAAATATTTAPAPVPAPVPRAPATTMPARGGYPPRGYRGGAPRQFDRRPRVDVPATDFDFERSNAKFNKTDLAGEVAKDENESEADGADVFYNKKSSFFDNLSNKETAEPPRFNRTLERKLNFETFGQASVDSVHFRGRGRGRGRGGMRGRGGHGPRGGFQAQNATAPQA